MPGSELLSAAGHSPAFLIGCPILISTFSVLNAINGGILTFGLYTYGPPFQLITTNLATLVFAALVIVFNRVMKTPHHKAMIGASLFLTYLQLMSAILYGGINQLKVTTYVQSVLYAAQDSTGSVCKANDCENYLTSEISSIIQGIISFKEMPNELMAVVCSVLSFLAQVATTLMLIAREKAAASESGNATTSATSDQDFTTTEPAKPKMDYSDL